MQAIAFESLQSLTGRLIGLSLLHSLWISLGVASAVAFACQMWPRMSHRSRYKISIISLLLVAALPIVIAPLHHEVASRYARREVRVVAITFLAGTGEVDGSRPPGHQNARTRVVTQSSLRDRCISILSMAFSHAVCAVRRFQPWLLAVWGAGVLICAGFLTLGAVVLRRMYNEGRPAPRQIQQRVEHLARRACLKSPPRVIVHPRAGEPFLCGLFEPAILLPESWLAGCQGDLLDAVLAHELAHVRRLDHWVNLAQRLVEVALFFSPAAYWLSRSVRHHREFCVDALAVRLTRDPLALAGALEWVAQVRLSSQARQAVGAALGGQNFTLLARIQELLGMKPSHSRARFWPLAALPAAGIMALIATVSGLSQDQGGTITTSATVESTRTTRNQKLATKIPSQAASAVDSLPIAPGEAETSRQIGYVVRYFDLNATARRELLRDRPKLVRDNSNTPAWIIEGSVLTALLEQLHTYNARKIHESSDLRAFQDATVTIKTTSGSRTRPKSRKDQESNPSTLGMQNDVIGSLLKLRGSVVAGTAKLTVDVRVEPFEGIAAPKVKFPPVEVSHNFANLPNVIHKRPDPISCEIPVGSSLVLSLRLDERQDQTAQGDSANHSTGQGQREGESPMKERLFLITPSRIVPERDQERAEIPRVTGGFDGKKR
jgi:beta-lactamase regulating signal transducer with metallopeptidase domain